MQHAMNYPTPTPGDVVTCVETGEAFTVARSGISFNYAVTATGGVVSDAGVDIRERRALLDRSRPFCCYLSLDGRNVTGWKGNVLGAVVLSSTVSLSRWSALHGNTMRAVRVRDVHGGLWHGRGSAGVAITLRAMKGAK